MKYDDLYALNDRLGAGTYPKPAHEYLNDWARPDVGWLRKYYPAGSDEPHFDATPAVEKALAWLRSLEARSYIGTESRLDTLFELLEQIAYGADDDSEVRLAELRMRRHDIDVEIADADRGNMAVLAVFVDVRAIDAIASEPGDEPDDFSVVSLVYGTDGTGVIRLLQGETPST